MFRCWIWITALVLVTGCMFGDGMMWDKISGDFMKEDKPYGPGDFRIRDMEVISMKLAKPELKFKPLTDAQLNDPNSKAEPTEPWMSNVYERANRRSVRILSGTINGQIVKHFEERAQEADWWLSPDWNTIYLATGWMDYHDKPKSPKDYTPQITKLFKSTDQGRHWQRLEWPENQNITFLRFLDAQRGYLIGWGPRIWRTADGGAHWTEIPVPAQARDPKDGRKHFDLVALGKDGVLRFAFFAKTFEQQANVSPVLTLRWGEDTPKLAFVLPQQTVSDIVADAQGTVYILSESRSPVDANVPNDDQHERLSMVSRWAANQLQRLHQFEPGLKGYALYLTPSGGLLFDGIDESRLLGNDVTAISRDGGKTWQIEEAGDSAQGGYYNTATGTRWRVSGYSLYKQAIP